MRVRQVFDKLGRVICVEEFEPRVLALTWVPLDRAMLCISCESVFAINDVLACPACGSEVFHPLHVWLSESRRGAITGELASRNPRPVAAPPEAFAPLVIRDGSSSPGVT